MVLGIRRLHEMTVTAHQNPQEQESRHTRNQSNKNHGTPETRETRITTHQKLKELE
jgi:hypothetical protein